MAGPGAIRRNVTDDDPARKASQYVPAVSVAPDGRVDVGWYDFRNDGFFSPGAEGNMGSAVGQRYWDVYQTYSRDAGRTWSSNLRVTSSSVDGKAGITFNNQDVRSPVAIASTNEATYLAWPDTRASGPGGDFSRVRFAAPAALGTGAGGGSKLPWTLLGMAIALGVGGVALIMVTQSVTSGEEVAPVPLERTPEGRPAGV